MYDHDRYLRTLSSFSKLLLTSYDVETVLGELASQVTGILGTSGSGVSLGRDGRIAYFTAVPETVVELERTQQATQSGPCVEAYCDQVQVVVPDLHVESRRWPEYCETAARVGLRAVAALPLTLGEECFGSLDLFVEEAREWDGQDLAAARVMADMATAYLVNASTLDQQIQLAAQLRTALDSRVLIEQAKGVVAKTHGISVDEAFERIRNHARRHQARLHEVTTAIVHLGLEV